MNLDEDYIYQNKPKPSYKYDPEYEASLDNFEATIDTESREQKAKTKSNLGNKIAGIGGGLLAGYKQGAEKSGNPYDIDQQYKPDGLMATSLSSQLSYEGLKRNKKTNTNFAVADWWQGMFGGGTEGYASGGWIGAIVGAATGGISSVVKGNKQRTEFRNQLRNQEGEMKQQWVEQETRLAKIGASQGAYNKDYKGVSQIALDLEKRNLDEFYQKQRKAAGMKDFKTNYYSS